MKINNNKLANTSITIIILGSFVAGASLGVASPEYYFIPLLAVVSLLYSLFVCRNNFKYPIVVASIVFVAAFYYSIWRAPQILDNDISRLSPQKDMVVIGTVVTDPTSRDENRLKFTLKTEKLFINGQNKPVSGMVMVTILDRLKKFDVIKIGYKLKLTGDLSLPLAASNPSQFDYRKYLSDRSVTANFFVLWNDYQILSPSTSLKYHLLNILNLFKDHIQEIHNKALKKHEAQLLGGIVLGDRAIPMDRQIRQEFINSGLAHILAASGLNVALLALAWIFVTSRLALPYSIQIIGGMIIVLFYSFLTGLPPSVLRAGIMLELILVGKLINKNANMVALIFFAAVLLLLINPYMINDIGFQLSFITALGLIISVPVFQKYITVLPESLAMLVLVPFIAQLWVLPIQLYHFHNIASYSVVANFFAMPLVAVITYGGFISCVLSIVPYIGVAMATFVDYLLSPILSLLLYLVDYISNLPASLEHFALNSIFSVLICYVLILIVLYAMWKKFSIITYFIITAVFISAFMLFSLLNLGNTQLTVVFFDVGDADCILLETPGKKHILIDGGKRTGNSFNSAESVLKPYLYTHKIDTIDAIFLTHPQNDHIGGIPEIVEEFKVRQFFDGGFSSKNKAYNKLLRLIYSKKIPYEVIRTTDVIDCSDGVRFTVLNPPEKSGKRRKVNQNSLLIRLDYSNFSILLAGDTEADVVKRIDKRKTDVEVLKVGHHGSKKSLTEYYLSLTTPDLAVISGGKKNVHPARNILDLLDKNKIPYLITGEAGAIQLISNGNSFYTKTFYKDRFK